MAQTTACVLCGGTVAPDGNCWDCGGAQPAFRAHLETTTDGGAAGVCDRGRREVNADAMALRTTDGWTIGVVCDGVSMSPRAERAAQVAAETGAAVLAARLRAGAVPEDAHLDAAVRAGHAVTALAASVTAAPACTYVAAIAGPAGVWACWIGDSRAYWLPDEGSGMALTEDDTDELEVLAAWLGADAGEPAPRVRSYRPPRPGHLLLCTDGLWRHLPDAVSLRARLAYRARISPPRDGLLDEARSLVAYALDSGGNDNITALLMPVTASVPAMPVSGGTGRATRRVPGSPKA